jgi:pilus assembly protein Flp/PilA
VFTTLSSMLRNDEGATLVEYSLVVALIAVAAIAAMTALGGNVSALFSKMSTDLQSA